MTALHRQFIELSKPPKEGFKPDIYHSDNYMSEMNMLLFRKIEELTLHLIEQNKIIEQLQEEGPERFGISPDSSGKKIEELSLYALELRREYKIQKRN